MYFTGNGVPLTQQWISIPDELRYLRVFFQLGIRMMHLTYQRRNMIGDGCGEKSDAGLSDFGRAVIGEMNRVGVISDCAHSGWQTSLESAQVSQRPVVASHTTCAALDARPHARSKPDKVIRAIADSGGYIGICCVSRFLRGSGDISMLLNHIDYVVRKFGIDHVAIGTDIAYSSQNSAAESRKVPRQHRRREEFRSLWPADDFQTTAKMTDSLGPIGHCTRWAWCSAANGLDWITCAAAGQSLTTRLAHQIDASRHYGHGGSNSDSLVTAIQRK